MALNTRHLGTAGDPVQESVVVEYNSFLVEPAYRPAFIDAVAHWLLTQSGGDIVQFDGFTSEETQELTAHWPVVATRQRESKYLDLSAIRATEGELIESLGRSTRANLRKRFREYGDLQLEWAETLEAASHIFDELIELHQARWQADGLPGAFASRRFAAFQCDLLTELFPQGRCVAFRVRHQGVTVGCLFLLVDRGRMLADASHVLVHVAGGPAMTLSEVEILILPGGDFWEGAYPRAEIDRALTDLVSADVPVAAITAWRTAQLLVDSKAIGNWPSCWCSI